MKIALLLPALLMAGVAQAQTNVLKVDIFQPIVNTLALSFEHKLSPSSSFQIGLSGTFNYSDDNGFGFSSSSGPKTSGFALTPEYRFYLSERREAMEGFYVAPYARYQYLNQSGNYYNGSGTGYNQSYSASLNSFGIGLIVGRQWIFKQRFSLDVYVGPGYTVSGVSSDQSGYTPQKSDFLGYYNNNNYDLRGGLTFGLAF